MISSGDVKSRMAGVMPSNGVVALTRSVDKGPTARSGIADRRMIPRFMSNERILPHKRSIPMSKDDGRMSDHGTHCPMVRIFRPFCSGLMDERGMNRAD